MNGLAGSGRGRGKAAAKQLQCSGCNNEKVEDGGVGVGGGGACRASRSIINLLHPGMRDVQGPEALSVQADVRRRQ